MKTRYTGSCHCGAVTFQAELDISQVIACNCSICSRTGWRLAFCSADDFELIQGEAELRDYQFAKKHIHHTFCSRCGVRPFSYGANPDGSGTTYSINVRCLDGVDAESLSTSHYDGASL